jgi:hypothetical protein
MYLRRLAGVKMANVGKQSEKKIDRVEDFKLKLFILAFFLPLGAQGRRTGPKGRP